jgi:hypothetical protein
MHEIPRRAVGRALAAVAICAALGCEPPPPIDLGPHGPTLKITNPEPGEKLELDSTCTLTEPIVVDVSGIRLVEPRPELVRGEGHWHGGPDLNHGYCLSDRTYCLGGSDSADYERYDGSGMTAGLRTLYAELQDNKHNDLGVGDQVEIELTDPGGYCGGAAGS